MKISRLIFIIFVSQIVYSQSEKQLSQYKDLSECFLSDAYINFVDIILSNTTQVDGYIHLQFTVYRLYSTCYDIEAHFQKGKDKFKMKQLYGLQQDGNQYSPVTIDLKFPVYEIQTICQQDSTPYINQCKLTFSIFRKGTKDEVGTNTIAMEAIYNQYSYIRYISWIRVSDSQQRQTQYRYSQSFQEIQQPENNLVVTASQYNKLAELDPYYPIKVKFLMENIANFENQVKYDQNSSIYQNFIRSKTLSIKFENYPTLYILKAEVGITYNINSTEFTQRNSTLISINENKLFINFQDSFEIVQEILLCDKIVVIKMFLKIKLVKDSYFQIERIPFYSDVQEQQEPEEYDIQKILSQYYIIGVVFAILLAMYLLQILVIKKLKNKKLQSTNEKPKLSRQISDEENNSKNVNINNLIDQSEEIKDQF